MKCYFCSGATESRAVTDLYAEGSLYLAVEDVPAEVCRQCGERYYTREVTKELLAITQKAKQHAALALPGQRAEVAICQWKADGGGGTGTMTDFWGILVPTLVGKSFYTLAQKREFRVEEMSDRHLAIIVSTGMSRRILRKNMEKAWNLLTSRGSLTREEIIREIDRTHEPWIAALLAQMPGVDYEKNPITLSYREAR